MTHEAVDMDGQGRLLCYDLQSEHLASNGRYDPALQIPLEDKMKTMTSIRLRRLEFHPRDSSFNIIVEYSHRSEFWVGHR